MNHCTAAALVVPTRHWEAWACAQVICQRAALDGALVAVHALDQQVVHDVAEHNRGLGHLPSKLLVVEWTSALLGGSNGLDDAALAEGVLAWRVVRLDERHQAYRAHKVLGHLLAVVVHVLGVWRMCAAAAGARQSFHCNRSWMLSEMRTQRGCDGRYRPGWSFLLLLHEGPTPCRGGVEIERRSDISKPRSLARAREVPTYSFCRSLMDTRERHTADRKTSGTTK